MSCLRPILDYSSVVCDSCSKYEKDCIERIQLEAAIFVTGTRRSISTKPYMITVYDQLVLNHI